MHVTSQAKTELDRQDYMTSTSFVKVWANLQNRLLDRYPEVTHPEIIVLRKDATEVLHGSAIGDTSRRLAFSLLLLIKSHGTGASVF